MFAVCHSDDQRPRRVTRRGRTVVAAAALAAAFLVPATARAEYATTTAQAVAAHADWLPYAAAPSGGAGAVCLVDSGVDLNADTTAAVIDRSTLDGGAADDAGSTHHGTLMAMNMAAPINGFGMVGAWPAVKIVDVRAVNPGTNSFAFADYQRGIARCQVKASSFPVSVVNLSIVGPTNSPTSAERLQLQNAVDSARNAGLSVVAAAGNDSGAVNEPANYAPVLAVGAGTPSDGTFCSFSSRGAGLDLVAPGCNLDQANPDGTPTVGGGGTSQASAFTSAILAALRSYKPSLTATQAEASLIANARTLPAGASLDVEATFRAEGLGAIVDAAKTAALTPPPSGGGGGGGGGGSSASSSTTTTTPQDAPSPEPAPVAAAASAPTVPVVATAPAATAARRLATPKLKAKLTLSKLGWRVTLANRPKGALAILSVYAFTKGMDFPFVVKTLRSSTSSFLVTRRDFDHLTVSYRDGFATDSSQLRISRPHLPRKKR